MEKRLLNDLSLITEQTHITLLEPLHTSEIQYLSKNVFYGTEKNNHMNPTCGYSITYE